MAEKKKKGMNVELNDFDFDEQDIARIQQERAGHADKVAQFKRDFVPTGSAFKDTSAMSGTSRDVKMMMHYDNLLDKAADRKATVRAQDAGLEVERGKIGVDQTRNTLFGRQIDNQMELGLKDLDLAEGELGINKAVLAMQQDRYNNVTKPSDRLSMAERAATARVGTAEAGFELSDNLFKETEKYLKDGKPVSTDPVAAPTTNPAAVDTPAIEQIDFNSSDVFPEYLRKQDWNAYEKPLFGALNEGVKSIGRGVDLGLQYLRPIEDTIMGMKPGTSARFKPSDLRKNRRAKKSQ